jgi:hypothetical protein
MLIREHGLKFVDTISILLDPLSLSGTTNTGDELLRSLNQTYSQRLPDIHVNNFQILQISFFAAIYANAHALGFNFDDYLDPESISPLTRVGALTEDEIKRAMDRYAVLPKSLRPVAKQITMEHHPYLVRIRESL